MRAHLSAWRAKPLQKEQYDVTQNVGDMSHIKQHVDAASVRLRDTAVRQTKLIGLSKKVLELLAQKGWEQDVREAWEDLIETEVTALMTSLRNAVTTDSWDTTRVLTIRQRDVLDAVFSEILGIPPMGLVASPESICRAIVALCSSGRISPAAVSTSIEKHAATHSSTQAIDHAKSRFTRTRPLGQSPLPSPALECRVSPYPTPVLSLSSDLQAELANLKHPRGRLSAIRKRQAELLLGESLKTRQAAELQFHKQRENALPLSESQLLNGSKLGTTPFLFRMPPASSTFSQNDEKFALNGDEGPRDMSLSSGGGGGAEGTPMSLDFDSLLSMESPTNQRPQILSSHSSHSSISLGVPHRSHHQHKLDNTSSPSMIQTPPINFSSLSDMLSQLKLSQYEWKLKKCGYDLCSDLFGISKDELVTMGMLPGHAQRLMNTVGAAESRNLYYSPSIK
eukprot:TRINITY_DN4115_c0_g1_i1.p1 TRINITY_DN4115_c0_g1~~TRINITY_DN4115_c0_g1_i1.p1  ORF type:complete len:452 (+),score=93.70 TRINITY_DN4115_c0_g1_i1:456-1811(+)